MSIHNEKDLEADLPDKAYVAHANASDLADNSSFDEIHDTRKIQSNITVLRKLREGEEWLDRVVGIELQGIDRVPDEAKQPPSIWNIFLLWWSLNVHVGVIPLGLLGAEFGLTLGQNVAATLIGSALGAICTGYNGTLSPKVSSKLVAIGMFDNANPFIHSSVFVKLPSRGILLVSGVPNSARCSTSSSVVASLS